MTENFGLTNQIQKTEEKPERLAKKKYRPPQVIYSAPLEAMAGACSIGGKATTSLPPCSVGINS